MRNWLKLAMLVGIGFAAAQAWRASVEAGSGEDGRLAPGFELPDLRGGTLDLSALRGKVVAVNFWATWCGPCNDEIPALAEAWREGRGRCSEIVGVTEESAREDVAEAVRRFAIPYPVVLDPRGEVARRFGVTGYPRTYVLDAEGRVRKVFTGRLSKGRLAEAMAPLLPSGCTGT
ncbi:MAG TPA: TlpA disulfide reductase family protein [Anaeromyxobacteraceae bacterium]|nr:TlpA disulfide reductase family protein [Anaeromyxobacteraceae bacterium]